ncbi:helix-turn-helix domain-containing protein [Aliarcobacter cryaerophilus]|uniref:helix-turn-helix domain-containing protein n=1 Tax=Aliarcobacter cryaerophilus TaxID=28198 RepID=UPI00082504B2|nr:helix-turn-helix domain-containing protein [Aliarcobacter cryaerophilus]
MNVSHVTKKIKISYGVSTNTELATKLGVSVSAIEAWSRRKEIPQKYIFQCTAETGVSIEWLLDEDKPTFHISGGSKNISQVNGGTINQGSEIEKEFELFDENDPVFISFKKAYECVKNEKNKLNELEDLLEDFYRKYR